MEEKYYVTYNIESGIDILAKGTPNVRVLPRDVEYALSREDFEDFTSHESGRKTYDSTVIVEREPLKMDVEWDRFGVYYTKYRQLYFEGWVSLSEMKKMDEMYRRYFESQKDYIMGGDDEEPNLQSKIDWFMAMEERKKTNPPAWKTTITEKNFSVLKKYGTEWECDGNYRLYLDVKKCLEAIGFAYLVFDNGKVSFASDNGERVYNSLMDEYVELFAQAFIDIKTGEFVWKNTDRHSIQYRLEYLFHDLIGLDPVIENESKYLYGPTMRVEDLAWTPTSRRLFVTSRDGNLRLYDARRGDMLSERPEKSSIVRVSSTGYVAYHSYEGIALKHVEESLVRTLGCNLKPSGDMQFSPDGRFLATGCADYTVKILDVDTDECVKSFDGHKKRVGKICYSPNGKYLASGDENGVVKIWSVETGECVRTIDGFRSGCSGVVSLCYSPDGLSLAVIAYGNKILFFDAQTGELKKEIEIETITLWSACYSPDGRFIAGGGMDKTIRIWNTQTGECVKTLKRHIDDVLILAWSPDGRFLASGGGELDKKVHICRVDFLED